MNFLMLRSNNESAHQEHQSLRENQVDPNYAYHGGTTLEGLTAEDPFQKSTSSESSNSESSQNREENDSIDGSSGKTCFQVDCHTDVTEDDGPIIIPYKEVPDNWTEAPNMMSFRSLDRSFVFPGEQIQILVCLSAYKQDTEIITPFRVAAVMNKNGTGQSPPKQNGNVDEEIVTTSQSLDAITGDQNNQKCDIVREGMIDPEKDVSTGETLIRMEDHKRQTEKLLQKFRNSHFFARISEANELLWSQRRPQEHGLNFFDGIEEKLTVDSSDIAMTEKKNLISAVIDRGKFDACTCGGVARGAVSCCSLSNGDIVVRFQVHVGFEFMKDPVLEILQFEKYHEENPIFEKGQTQTSLKHDPSGDLLKWLLPLDNSFPSSARPLSPPILSSSASIRSTSTKHTVAGSTGSQLFSFGHFRSHSMSSLPQSAAQSEVAATPNSKSSFDPKSWNQFSFRKFVEGGKSGNERLLSFRGVPLEPERFSVQCGLEGIFRPGRRWRRRIELIQPVEIHSFAVDCNTEDLLCVHVKNVSPPHVPDILVFLDSISIVSEEASKGGQPSFSPIACVEAGNGYSFPNLALRRGEAHSFILKPATTVWKRSKGQTNSNLLPSRSSYIKGKHGEPSADKYAVLLSCRCNYTESKLFFKHPTSWRPRFSRNLMISVASKMSRQTLGSDGTQLPVQVLTLQAANMTPDDLTLTVLAPASFSSPSSVLSLSNSPSSPLRTIAASANLDKQTIEDDAQSVPANNVVPNSDVGCTHLWLQSKVPLGCVPSQSMATIKLEVLPLTDGIITLDSLRIHVKETGCTYVPDHPLKINATSSIATSVI